jgi:hypothetical protein
VAILARSLGIPAICGISQAALALQDGREVILDGTAGTLNIAPTAAEKAEAEAAIARLAERRAAEQAMSQQPGQTSDGSRIEVVANIRNAADAREAVKAGAEGVGLLRSEFLFDNRDTAPSEAEQAAEYCAVARELGSDRPLVVRTLDVGGDKPLSYLPCPRKTTPSSACAASASAWIARTCCAPSCVPFCKPHRSPACTSCSPWWRPWTSCAPPRPFWPKSKLPAAMPTSRWASWWKYRRPPFWLRVLRRKWISSPSAPTTSPSTYWRWTVAIRNWPNRPMPCIRACWP